jgi:LPXTG-motif cell wall-anchored protein
MRHRYNRAGQCIITVGLLLGGIIPATALAASSNASSGNDMMCGGASSPTQFAHKLDYGDSCDHSATELRQLYTRVNADVTAKNIMNGNTTYGTVTKSGDVMVGGKVVATNATSYGRTDLGDSQMVGSTSDPLYGRPPAVSFLSNSLPAMVHIVNGTFRYAIVESCGNLVTATPKMAALKPAVVAPTPTPTPTPTPVSTPAPVVNVTQIQYQTQSQTTIPAKTVATATPAPAATPVASTALPQTGASAAGLGGMSLLVTAIWYWRRSRRGLRLALRLPTALH